ncbi:MAG: hypothetical protein NVS3B20_18210 [Polyangiales bacterium]
MTDRPQPTYTQAEVNAILSRALEQQAKSEGLTHQELLVAAREVGISQEAMEQAVAQLGEERAIQTEIATQKSRRWRGFMANLTTYIFVNALLIFIDFKVSGGTWFYWPLLGWGLALLLQLRAAMFPNLERLERRRQRRETRRAIKRSAKEFESVVTRGVGAVLDATAKRIRGEPLKPAQDPRLRVDAVDAVPYGHAQPPTRVDDAPYLDDEIADQASKRNRRR